MWIKSTKDRYAPYVTYVNTDRVFKFKVTLFNGKYAVEAIGDGSAARIALFDTEWGAQAFIDRLVNKLGLVVIDASEVGND